MLKFDWKIEEIKELYHLPFFELISQANKIHAQYNHPGEIQVCNLISIKTGGCPEDCRYCAQSSYYKTPVTPQKFLPYEEVISKAKSFIKRGVTRICLAAAWREVKSSKQFDQILGLVQEITSLGAEVCCTLGMLNQNQAEQLKAAGLYAYNHNLDTSERFYPQIITTRTYQDRINTLNTIEGAGIGACCGGILGLGEEIEDRLELLKTLANRNPHPQSVPINTLSRVPGTPLENQQKVSIWEMVRMIALARIMMPKTVVRLACGRNEMSYEEQALCFIAGANSIFLGEKLLTVGNNSIDEDEQMFQLFNFKKRPAFSSERVQNE